MSDIYDILPSHLSSATEPEKKMFFQALVCLSGIDGRTDPEEIDFIADVARSHGVENFDEICDFANEQAVLDSLAQIKNRPLALELIRELCMLAHIDNVLSDEETLFIGKAGLAMGIEIEKIEQISNWIIDRIIWLEQAKIIFEEK